MNNKIVLMKSLPGAGKTTLAKKIIKDYEYYPHRDIYSTDDYFTDCFGKYDFDASKLGVAHKFTQATVRIRVDFDSRSTHQLSLVIVDNTFTQAWECKPYYDIAKDYGWDFELVEPNTPWAFDVDELARKNVHGVPKATIQKMKDRWQTSEEIMQELEK